MKSLSQESRHFLKNDFYLGLILLFILMGLGCARTHTTTKTETTVTPYSSTDANRGYIYRTTAGDPYYDQQGRDVAEGKETTTTTTESKTKLPGVIGSTFHAIGYVFSLPFIVIGGLFRILFGG